MSFPKTHSDELTEKQTACTMSKHDLILRVSKQSTDFFSFSFETNLSTGHQIILPQDGILPETGTTEFEKLKADIKNTLRIIFLTTGHKLGTENGCFTYKVIFSDKFECTGFTGWVEPENGKQIETIKTLTHPMGEAECKLIFGCIPWAY